MRPIFLTAALLWGCASTQQSPEVASIQESPSNKRIKDVAREFYADIGGEDIPTVNGIYFHPVAFAKSEGAAYKKWKRKLALAKNCKLAEIFQVDFQGNNLLSLFSLPRTGKLKKEECSALCLPSFSLPFEFDPKWILTYLSKGIHVLAINYEKEKECDAACKQALLAGHWLRRRVDGKRIIVGKALGTIPAAYVGSEIPHAHVILENALALHPLTTKEWLKAVQGKLLVIETLLAKAPTHLPKSAIIMHITGSHFGPYFGENAPVWYENEKDQQKLLKFLRD